MTIKFGLFGAATTALVICLASTGCGSPSETELIGSAKKLIQEKNDSAAVIQLKSALQQNPQSGEARYLLGKALFGAGSPVYAIVELGKARDLKYSDAQVLPILARALLATGDAKKVVDSYGEARLDDPRALADLKTVVAMALAAQGQRDRSEAALGVALRLDAKNVDARLLQARLAAGRGQSEQALSMVDSLLKDAPQTAEAWYFKGELSLHGKRTEDAAQSFKRALTIEPKAVKAHISLLNTSLNGRDIPAFKAQLEQMKAALPGHPDTRYFEAQAHLLDRDFKKARDVTQQLLRAVPDNPRLLELAGVIELADGSLVLAEAHLAKAVQARPERMTARRLLAQAYVRSGQPARALTTLQPVLDQAPDATALALAGEAHLQSGQLKESEAYFAKAVKVTPDDPRIQTALALAKIAKGDSASGFSALEELATKDQATSSDLALIAARIRRNDLSNALLDVDRLKVKLPASALPHYLRGRIQLQLNDVAAARASFDKATAVDSNYFPAIASLSALDLAEKHGAQAVNRFEVLLAREPGNYRAVLAIANIKQHEGATPATVSELLRKAIKVSPQEVVPRVLWIEHLLNQKDYRGALAAAQEALTALPENPQIVEALGQAQLASGDVQQAISTLTKGVGLQPASIAAHSRLAQAHLANKDAAAARRSLNRVLELDPKELSAQSALIQLAMAEKHPNDALAIARAVQKQRPVEATGYLMEADVLINQRRWDLALEAIRAALDRQRSTSTALRLHAVLLTAGKTAEAGRFAESWMREQAKDIAFLSYLGAIDIDQRRFVEAENRFRGVLLIDANNVNALNNVAWTLIQQGKKGALAFAGKANELAPGQPAFVDTLAEANAAEGDLQKAVQLQRTAVEKSGGNPEYRFRLAKLLVKSGNQDAARKELSVLSQMGDKFVRQAEATQLLKSL